MAEKYKIEIEIGITQAREWERIVARRFPDHNEQERAILLCRGKPEAALADSTPSARSIAHTTALPS